MEYNPMVNVVSIHALREESDPVTLRLTKRSKNFNPHSPCGERPTRYKKRTHISHFNPHSPCGERPKLNRRVSSMHSFQSTLPLRGATVTDSLEPSPVQFQSTLPLRGATNVHFDIRWLDVFQSTLPLRGATRAVKHAIRNRMISIHTPLAGSDWRCRRVVCRICHFNPHSPCGERPPSCSSVSRCRYFNPHSPCGERRSP